MRGVQLIQCNFALITSVVQLRFALVFIMFTQISYETIIQFIVAHWRHSQLIFVCCHKVTNNVEFTFRITNIYYLCRTGLIEWCLFDQRQTDHIIECEGNKSRSTSFSNTWLFLTQGRGRYSKVWYCDSRSNIEVFWIVVERLHISRIFVRLKMFSIVEFEVVQGKLLTVACFFTPWEICY